MNLKVKTLHELLTLSLWLDARVDPIPNIEGIIPSKAQLKDPLLPYRKLLWDVNEEIDLRLLGDTYNLKIEENDNTTIGTAH
jgi:hypothetical protein